MQPTRDQERKRVQVGSLDNEFFDGRVMRVNPLAVVFAFNTERAGIVAILIEIRFLVGAVGADIFWRLRLTIAALGIFAFGNMETALIRKAR